MSYFSSISKDHRYSYTSRWLHWIMATIFILQCVMGFLMQEMDRSIRGSLYGLHKQIGLAFLILITFRVINRYYEGWLHSKMPSWQLILSKIIHYMLYSFMILMPISGWLMSSYAGYPVNLFGVWKVILPVTKLKSSAEFYNAIHRYLSYLFYIAFFLHLSGFIHHTYIKKDSINKKMSLFR